MRRLMLLGFTIVQSACSVYGSDTVEAVPQQRLIDSTDEPEIGKIVDAESDFCSGTLIGSNVILTAAHCCLDLRPPLTFNVYTDAGRRSWVYPIARTFPNPSYADGSYVHDVGLMQLALPVPTSTAHPRAISTAVPPNGTTLTIWGYSSTSSDAAEGWQKHYAAFEWPNKTSFVWYGDSGGPVIRGDDGSIVRVVSGILENTYVALDLSAPLSANAAWLDATLTAIANQ
jgi:protease YdgD